MKTKNFNLVSKLFTHKKFFFKTITIFFRQLETLLTSGINITQCCDILIASETNKNMQTFLMTLRKSLITGLPLSKIMRLHPHYFDDLSCHFIFIGEQTGTLTTMLNRIATQREFTQQFKQKLQKALLYPALVTIMAIMITFLMFIEIIPKFAELFTQTHVKLPLLTRSVLAISHWLQTQSMIFILLITIFSCITYCYRKKCYPFFHNYLLKLSLMQHIYLARFTRQLAITCSSGILLTDAIPWIAKTAGNLLYEKALLNLQQELHKGKSLYISMSANPYFSKKTLQMIKIGEESGKLSIMLEKIASQSEAAIEYWASHLANFLEPLIMCILGVLIGVLVIAMYLPIFKLGMVI